MTARRVSPAHPVAIAPNDAMTAPAARRATGLHAKNRHLALGAHAANVAHAVMAARVVMDLPVAVVVAVAKKVLSRVRRKLPV